MRARSVARGIMSAAFAVTVLLAVAAPAAADPTDCLRVGVQPQPQGGTAVTPVNTGTQYGAIVSVDATPEVGVFASAQVRPSQCIEEGPPHPPQDVIELPVGPVSVSFPDVQGLYDESTGLLP